MPQLSARFLQAVEVMVCTSPSTIDGVEIVPGDFIVADGQSTVGVPHDVFVNGSKYRPSSSTGADLIVQARRVRDGELSTQMSLPEGE